MRIEYRVEIEDLVEFTLFHMERSPTTVAQRRVGLWSIPTICLLCGAGVALPAWPASVVFLGIAVFWLAWYPGYYRRHVRTTVTKLYSEGANRCAAGSQELELAHDCLIHRTPHSDGAIRFEALEGVEETGDHAFVYVSAASAHVLPRRKVSVGDYRAFVDAVVRAVSEARVPQGAMIRAPRVAVDRVFRREEGTRPPVSSDREAGR